MTYSMTVANIGKTCVVRANAAQTASHNSGTSTITFTIAIVNQSGAGTAGAASLANDYVGPNNSTDWYLPSKDELAQLYAQSALVSASTGYYWSSSEYLATLAWRQPFFGAGTPEQDVKSAYSWNLVARAIRAF